MVITARTESAIEVGSHELEVLSWKSSVGSPQLEVLSCLYMCVRVSACVCKWGGGGAFARACSRVRSGVCVWRVCASMCDVSMRACVWLWVYLAVCVPCVCV